LGYTKFSQKQNLVCSGAKANLTNKTANEFHRNWFTITR